MWSFVQKKENQRWLWHVCDHLTDTVLAYVFGNRKDIIFEQLKSLLEPFGINRFYSDDWGVYERKYPLKNMSFPKRTLKK